MSQPTSSAQDDWFAPEDSRALALLWRACGPRLAPLLERAQALLSPCSPDQPASRAGARAELAALESELRIAMTGDVRPLAARLSHHGARLARAGADLRPLSEASELVRREFVHLLVEQYLADPVELEQALHAMQRFLDRAFDSITREYLSYRQQLMEEQQRFKDEALLRFTRLSESGVLGILVCDYMGNIREANDAFLAMIGYTREDLLSGRVRWLELTPPEWAHLDEEAIAQLRASGRTRLWEKEYFRKDGSRLPILVSVATLNEQETVAFVLDISERKSAEELRARSVELEAENRRIQEASRLKSEFLANMSHELRTPLNSIIGFADLLFDGEIDASAPEHREFLGDILKSGRHLLQLINDVLDLAKIEAGKMDFRPEPVSLSKLVAEAIDVVRPIAVSNSVALEQRVESEVDEVVVDPARLKQVLYNYVSNALKFTPSGGRVAVRAVAAGESSFRLEVEDTGIGIEPKNLRRLFTEFEQLDHGTTKRHAGTGLGLALTKRIVEAQGGTVGVHSVLGQGSIFSATLPCRADVKQDLSTSVIPERYDDAALILVVEDDLRDRQVLVRMLNGVGFGVEIAACGMQAIGACRERSFDAITLDLLLPDISGLDVLRRIRREGLNQFTPVLVVSVVAERDVVNGFAVHDFFSKPMDPSKLLESLSRAGVTPHNAGPILVIDDDLPSLKLMQTTLRKLGYAVECRTDAESALESAKRQQHLAVVLDLLMPGMDGFEFLRHFRSLPENRLTPVIVWTIKDLTLEDHHRLHKHAQAVFEKGNGRPLSLVEELRSLLRARANLLGGAAV